MAGDVDLAESVVSTSASRSNGRASPMPVLHDYGPGLKIAIGIDHAPRSPINEEALSAGERLGLEAFRLRLSGGYLDDKARRPHAAAAWGSATAAPQLHRDRQVIVRGAPVAAGQGRPSGAPEAMRLAGRIAVGIVIVSGPGMLEMTGQQQRKLIAEVQNGLSYLGGQAPARDVTFAYDIQLARIGLADTQGTPPAGASVDDCYEFYEGPWRDAALATLGLSAGGNGIRDYIRKIKADKQAQAAYCAFFTHYTLYHFAYCSGSYLTMHYANDGWGEDNLDRVFAHETGHIFGAPDEYAESGCNCGGSWGVHGRPNLNCENCADGGGVDCIMKKNSWTMCEETPYHLGYTILGV